jgi:hypothetical protein
MFHVQRIQGRVFSGTLEQLRQRHLVTGVARVRRVAPAVADPSPSRVPPSVGGVGHALGAEAAHAYGKAAAVRVRQALTCAADVMHRPALTVPTEATLREAWWMLVGGAFVWPRHCARAGGETEIDAMVARFTASDRRGVPTNGCGDGPPDRAQVVVAQRVYLHKRRHLAHLVSSRSWRVFRRMHDGGDGGPVELSPTLCPRCRR